MSEFKGTPGPWELKVEPLDQTVALDAIGCGVMVSSATPWSSDSERDIGKAFANASLIAAAPELLEALQSLLLSHQDILHDEYSIDSEEDEDCVKARAAITKALGQ